jgi:hypothetical protein
MGTCPDSSGFPALSRRLWRAISGFLHRKSEYLSWIIHKIVANNTYLSENIKGEIEKSHEE